MGRGREREKDNIDHLLKLAYEHPPLGEKVERELAKRFKAGDKEAGKKLILSHLRYVIKLAYKYRNWGVPLEDLIMEGIFGFIEALKRYNPNRTKLITYSTYWIKAYIHNYIMSFFSSVKLGTSQDERKIFSKIFKFDEDMSSEEIADELDVGTEKVEKMRSYIRKRDLSLDFENEENLKLADIIPDTSEDTFERVEKTDRRKVFEILKEVMLKLDRNKRYILQQKLIYEKIDKKKIASELNLKPSDITKLEREVDEMVRNHLNNLSANV